MFKKILAVMTLLFAGMAFAAVDVNKATAAQLDGIKGIGPGTSSKILEARKKGEFKDWNDLVVRVKGIGEGNAAKLSAAGLTVGGASFKASAAAPVAKAAEAKPAVKTEPKAAAKVEPVKK